MTTLDNDTDPTAPSNLRDVDASTDVDPAPRRDDADTDVDTDEAPPRSALGRKELPSIREMVRRVAKNKYQVPASLEPGVAVQVGPHRPPAARADRPQAGVFVATDPGPPATLTREQAVPTVVIPPRSERRRPRWPMLAAGASGALVALVLVIRAMALSGAAEEPHALAAPSVPIAHAPVLSASAPLEASPLATSAAAEPTPDASSVRTATPALSSPPRSPSTSSPAASTIITTPHAIPGEIPGRVYTP